jgi:ABC-type transport system involved in multi-copper enzyme maturation permease subunit
MNVLLAKLWLSFWHLLPANPILVRVVHGGSRRPRHLWLRASYLGTLLFVVLGSLVMTWQSGSLAELAKGASQTFKWASTVQLMLMCFLAPVFTASAITQERDAQTFNILLSTPLSSAQIVLGSLMSRLFFVIMLLLSGLPIFLMTMVYGGVTTRQIVESFALCASTAILTGALAIFVAMIGVGTRRTIFSFYLLIALYLLAVYLLGRWNQTWVEAAPANIAGLKMSWLTPLHPFLALDVALNRVQAPSPGQLAGYGAVSRHALAFPSATYVLWTTALAVLLIVLSMFFVRRGAKIGETTFVGTFLDRFRRHPQGERTRPPRSVWANPVAWREATARASSGALVRWAIIVGGLVGSLIILVDYLGGGLASGEVPVWLAGLTAVQVAVALLIATNTAATSMTKEKESKTMDLLLTTPLTSKYILWGKLRGLVSFAAPLLAGPVLMLLLFATIGLSRKETPPVVWIETAVELGTLLVVYTALACVIGLRFSLTSKTNVSAVMSSVGLVIVLGGLASMIGLAMVDASRGEFGAFLAPFTPFTAIKFLINPAALFDNSMKDFAAGAPAVRVAALLGCLIAIISYAFVVWRWYVGLVRDFDMTMRKQAGN